MREVTEDLIREVYAQGGAAPAALLVTITAAGMADPIRITDCPDGVTSRGEDYLFFPLNFAFPGAGVDEPEREPRMELANVDGRIAEAVRAATSVPIITVEMVRLEEPDVVEVAVRDAEARNVQVEGAKVTMNLRGRNIARELACSKRYVAARTPGLF